MFASEAMNIKEAMTTIARHYIGMNPARPPAFKAFNRSGILRGSDYRYTADFNKIFPDASPGSIIYAWARIWAGEAHEIRFDVDCHCPVTVYVNGEKFFRSSEVDERFPNTRTRVIMPLSTGWNYIVVKFKKTKCAFGGVFGTWLGKLPYYFLLPDPERGGQEGWLYTEPLTAELPGIPGGNTMPDDFAVRWFPEADWLPGENTHAQLQRMYGKNRGTAAIGWTRAFFTAPSPEDAYSIRGNARAPLTIRINDGLVCAIIDKPGDFDMKLSVPFGLHDIFVYSECDGSEWGYDIALFNNDKQVDFMLPVASLAKDAWIYLGPLDAKKPVDWKAIASLPRLSTGADGQPVYWRFDKPGTWLRIYNDAATYGNWTYPIGVILYGLLKAGHKLNLPEISQYAVSHMQQCCDLYEYTLWDREQYGGATGVLHLMASMDSLDDCGSAGSAMLEIARASGLENYRKFADHIADFIKNRQTRLPDGTFYRKDQMHDFCDNTMWADDLYMSGPFLCRYYQLTNDRRYLEDAVFQFLSFRKYLYIPHLDLMSHVYDFNRRHATGIPWGRGNGWALFSLAELLKVLPGDHPKRSELLAFFNEFSSGILAWQDGTGMWHQVLDEHDSYRETSCTAMFIYAFCRGARHGWYKTPAPYIEAALRGWRAMMRTSVDAAGNVHGVCVGSNFSFQSFYYKNDLPWKKNDTHGIGIVLLAGTEILNLQEHFQKIPWQ